jgi:hypothetical protein
VNAPRIRDHGLLNLTSLFAFTVHTDEWCVHNRQREILIEHPIVVEFFHSQRFFEKIVTGIL